MKHYCKVYYRFCEEMDCHDIDGKAMNKDMCPYRVKYNGQRLS